MGGRGSGRHSGLSADKCHEYHSVDLAWRRRKGCLRPGYSGNLTWSRCGAQTGNISYRVETAGIRLIYRTRPHGGEWQDVNELIPFVGTSTNFGGSRQWFLCPSCRKRCRILYGGSRFRCRRCYRLKYESQYEPAYGRAATRAHKLRERLGYSGALDDPFPPKPKGMHWKTYRRLETVEAQCREQWALDVMGWMTRLEGGRT
jgi:hypothetical protein